jgi:2-polyprenyl-6-methoxyphenol hydroxylase-like FAD-dependent oxidoreductase
MARRQHFLAGKKIIIAGGGMCGLAFAIALRKQWNTELEPPQIMIYERDTQEVSAGREGYSLSLAGFDNTGGLFAMMQLGLLDATLEASLLGLEGTGSFKIWDGDWSELLSVCFKPAAGLPTAGIRIARKNLRRILVDGVSVNDEIKWDVTCIAAEKLDNGRIRVQLSGGGIHGGKTIEECDLLVAADGANSKIRASLRPNDSLQYTGAIQWGGSSRFESKIPEPIDNNWGMMLSNGEGVACFLSPIDEHRVIWAVCQQTLNPQAYDRNSKDQVQKLIDNGLALTNTFGEPFKTIVEHTDLTDTFYLATRDKQPFYHDCQSSVAFIGDSNHAVSPFAGYGASLALKDGWDLAEQVCAADNMAQALAAYDAISVPRAIKVLKESHWRIKNGLSTGFRYSVFTWYVWFGGLMLRLFGRS